MKRTDYKRLYRKSQRELLLSYHKLDELMARLTISTRLLVSLRNIVDKYIPEDRKEEFKKELDKTFENENLETSVNN
jgi:hypothetical protein